MAMTLRLSEEETEALRNYAAEHGQSMQDAAREAVRALVHNDRVKRFSQYILERDRELLARLAK